MTSSRRSNDGPGQEVKGSTAGATAAGDLEEVGRLFVEWAVRERLFTEFADDDRVPIALARGFAAGYKEGNVKSAQT